MRGRRVKGASRAFDEQRFLNLSFSPEKERARLRHLLVTSMGRAYSTLQYRERNRERMRVSTLALSFLAWPFFSSSHQFRLQRG